MRRAEIRTALDEAETVAAAIRPDNTAEMDTHITDGAIVTTIERESTGGLRSTVDDYVVNVAVATRTIAATTPFDPTTRTDEAATRTANDATQNEQPDDRHDTTSNGDTTQP